MPGSTKKRPAEHLDTPAAKEPARRRRCIMRPEMNTKKDHKAKSKMNANTKPKTDPKTDPKTKPESEVIEIEPDDTFHMSISLNTRFTIYPRELRNKLAGLYLTLMRQQERYLDTVDPPEQTYSCSYSILNETSTREISNNDVTNVKVLREGMISVAFANIAVMDHDLKVSHKGSVQREFVKLGTVEGLANPAFVKLHSVRHGETGWGLDCHGCLSLYTVSVVDGKLKECVTYVKRYEIKEEKEIEVD